MFGFGSYTLRARPNPLRVPQKTSRKSNSGAAMKQRLLKLEENSCDTVFQLAHDTDFSGFLQERTIWVGTQEPGRCEKRYSNTHPVFDGEMR